MLVERIIKHATLYFAWFYFLKFLYFSIKFLLFSSSSLFYFYYNLQKCNFVSGYLEKISLALHPE